MSLVTAAAPPSYLGLKQLEASLPSSFYLDPAHHDRELKALWYRNWIYVCRASALSEPRAFRTFSIGDQSILVVRNDQGALRAFHNTCRHRGSALCSTPEGKLRGKLIVCPYHSWSYDLDGRLAVVPGVDIPAGFDRQDYSLYRVDVAEWNGCVFVRLEGSGASLDDAIRPNSRIFANWPMAELQVGHTMRTTLACNWKIFWENYNECYHCPGVHPELCKIVPIYGRSISGPYSDPQYDRHRDDPDPKFHGGLRKGAVTWSTDGQPIGPTFPTLTEEERKFGQRFATIWPTMYAVGHVDYMRIVSMRPLGPEQTDLTVEWLFTPELLADKSVDLERVTKFAQLVVEQDGAACELNQAGLRSRAHKQGVLMPQEHSVFAFHEWVRRGLAAA